jgi:hypothetical protein
VVKAMRTCENCGAEGPIPDQVEYYWIQHPTEPERLTLIRLCRECKHKAWDLKRKGLPTKKVPTQKNRFGNTKRFG